MKQKENKEAARKITGNLGERDVLEPKLRKGNPRYGEGVHVKWSKID